MGAADASVYARHMIEAGGFSIQFLKGGRGEPLVYVHGLGGGGKWESYHMAFANDSLVYAPVLPGWREWEAPAGLTSIAAYAALLVEFLDALGIERVTLAGHSIGAWIALRIAATQPERVARLLAVDSLGIEAIDAPAVDLGLLDEEAFGKAVFARLGLTASAQAYGFGAEFTNLRTSPEFERQWRGRGLVASLVGGPCADRELMEQLSNITAQTLIVTGEFDGLAPLPQARFLQSALAGAGLAIIEGAGHLPMVEKKETFHRVCHDFLCGIDEQISGVAGSRMS